VYEQCFLRETYKAPQNTSICMFLLLRFTILRFTDNDKGKAPEVLCFACMLSEPEWPKVVLAAMGILGMSIAFPTVYLYSAELFPTVVRNVGVGTSSMCARFGSMVAPYITSLASSKHFHILLEIIILTDCKFQTSWKELYLRSALSLILKGLQKSAVLWRRLK